MACWANISADNRSNKFFCNNIQTFLVSFCFAHSQKKNVAVSISLYSHYSTLPSTISIFYNMSYVARKRLFDFPSYQSQFYLTFHRINLSVHALPLSQATCLILWQKTYVLARLHRLARTFAVPICYNSSFLMKRFIVYAHGHRQS